MAKQVINIGPAQIWVGDFDDTGSGLISLQSAGTGDPNCAGTDECVRSVTLTPEGNETAYRGNSSGVPQAAGAIEYGTYYTIEVEADGASTVTYPLVVSGIRNGDDGANDDTMGAIAYASGAEIFGVLVVPCANIDPSTGEVIDPDQNWWIPCAARNKQGDVVLNNNTGVDAQNNFTFMMTATQCCTNPSNGSALPDTAQVAYHGEPDAAWDWALPPDLQPST